VQTWERDSVSAFSANESARAEAALKNSRRADDLRCVVVSTATLSPARSVELKLTRRTEVH
jgi:hypothetical protein